MRVEILGCSGGIGAAARTTCLRIDHDVLIDAGTGLGDLPLAELARIDHVFLTHSHLDHLACLPLMLDSVGAERHAPVTVHATAPTLAALTEHLFNNRLWPDFSRIPSPEAPFVRFAEIVPGNGTAVNGRRFYAVAVNHAVPAVGYLVSGDGGTLAFSGDTTATGAFWAAVDRCGDLRAVIIETTFPDADAGIAEAAKHLCPSLLAAELAKYRGAAPVYVTHLMPGAEEAIMREIALHLPRATPQRLVRGQVLTI